MVKKDSVKFFVLRTTKRFKIKIEHTVRGTEQIKKRSICRHSPNRWVGGLGHFKKKLLNLFLTLGGVKPLFY